MTSEFRFMRCTHATRNPVHVADMPHEHTSNPNSGSSCCRYATRQGVFGLFVLHQSSTSIDIYQGLFLENPIFKPVRTREDRT